MLLSLQKDLVTPGIVHVRAGLGEVKEDVPHIEYSALKNIKPFKKEDKTLNPTNNLWICTYNKKRYILQKCVTPGEESIDGGLKKAAQKCISALLARFFDESHPEVRIVKDIEKNEYYTLSTIIKGFYTVEECYQLNLEQGPLQVDARRPNLTQITDLIKARQIVNLGKMVATSFIIAANNVGEDNIGFAPLRDAKGHVKTQGGNSVFTFVGMFGSSCSFDNFKIKDEGDTLFFNTHLGRQDFAAAPFLSCRSFYPANWFGQISHHVIRPDGFIIDKSLSKNIGFRTEFNGVFFEFALLMQGLFIKIITAVLKHHPLAQEFMNFFTGRAGLIQIALNTMPMEPWSFANFLLGIRESEITAYLKKLNSFSYNGELVFKDKQRVSRFNGFCCNSTDPHRQEVLENTQDLQKRGKKSQIDFAASQARAVRLKKFMVGAVLQGDLAKHLPSMVNQGTDEAQELTTCHASPIRTCLQILQQQNYQVRDEAKVVIGESVLISSSDSSETKPEIKAGEIKLEKYIDTFNQAINNIKLHLNHFHEQTNSDVLKNMNDIKKLKIFLIKYGKDLNLILKPLNDIIDILDEHFPLEKIKHHRGRMVLEFQLLTNKFVKLREEMEARYRYLTTPDLHPENTKPGISNRGV